MNKKLIILFFILTTFSKTFSQNKKPFVLKQNNINVELLGTGYFYNYAVNYERLFPLTEKTRIGAAMGYTALPLGQRGLIHSVVPASSFIYGEKHNLEAGLAFTKYLGKHIFAGVPSIRIGYRYQHKNFLFKAATVPYLTFKPKVSAVPQAGLALGFCF